MADLNRTLEINSMPDELFDLINEDVEMRPGVLRIKEDRVSKERGLLSLSRGDQDWHSWIKLLAGHGYLLSWSYDGGAQFVHREWVSKHWSVVQKGVVDVSPEGILHTFEKPKRQQDTKRLVVVLSGIPGNYNDSALWRYFPRQFQHIASIAPEGTATLRIADLGGVVGAFYGNTAEDPENQRKIAALITDTMDTLSLGKSDVCIVGSSKGATGAVLHGVSLDLPFVAVDPVLSDRHYEVERADAHFTGKPVFDSSKDDSFTKLLTDECAQSSRPCAVLTSPNSAQYVTNVNFAKELRRPTALVESRSPSIKQHPDVAGVVYGSTVSLVHNLLMGWPIPEGHHTIR